MGLLTNNDSTLFRNFFKEMAKLRGLNVEYVYPVENNVSIHGDVQPDFSSIFNLDIIFDTNPKVKTLKNYGWVSEDPNDKPYLGYFPFDTPHIQKYSRIKLDPRGVEKEGRWFEITDITEAIEFPDCYACKLAPVYVSSKPKLNYEQTNDNYIEGDNQPDEANHHHKLINEDLAENLPKEIEKDPNFSYLKV